MRQSELRGGAMDRFSMSEKGLISFLYRKQKRDFLSSNLVGTRVVPYIDWKTTPVKTIPYDLRYLLPTPYKMTDRNKYLVVRYQVRVAEFKWKFNLPKSTSESIESRGSFSTTMVGGCEPGLVSGRPSFWYLAKVSISSETLRKNEIKIKRQCE